MLPPFLLDVDLTPHIPAGEVMFLLAIAGFLARSAYNAILRTLERHEERLRKVEIRLAITESTGPHRTDRKP